MTDLNKKKILLLIPGGRGIFGTGISNELESRGARVTVYNERPSTSTLSKIALRSAKNYMEPYLSLYFKRIIYQNNDADFDYILVVRGEGLTPRIVKMLRKKYTNAKLILYLWESLGSYDIQNVFPLFDRIYSYDKIDVENNPYLSFRPLFFLPNYGEIVDVQYRPIDILFIGTVHSDRFSLIKKIQPFLTELNISTYYYFYLPSRLLFLRNKVLDRTLRNSKIDDFKYKMMTADQAAFYLSMAKSSLDIEKPGQTGLSMRTFEVLGARRKLITTNRFVKSYDFYDEHNILIIDRIDPKIDPVFIYTPYKEITPQVYNNYSLKGWIDEVLSTT